MKKILQKDIKTETGFNVDNIVKGGKQEMMKKLKIRLIKNQQRHQQIMKNDDEVKLE